MTQFIVSARKYRPTTFNSVVGQSSITSTLKNAIRSNQLAQAYLFTGPRGVGKTTCARIFAKTINCTNLSADCDCCNECESCVTFNNGQSLNIFELDAASNNSVDDIRNLVEQVRYPPQGAQYKTYIIDEVHMLSAGAFNAFLKTLEEPPAYAKFILATTEKHKIIPTVLSRCQIFDFNRITVVDMAKHLEWVAQNENVTAEPEALHLIALKADGGLRDALSIFDQIVSFAGNHITAAHVSDNLNVVDQDHYFTLVDHLLKGGVSPSIMLLDEILKDGFNLQHFIGGFASHIRDLMVCKDPQTAQLIEAPDFIKEKLVAQSARIPAAMIFQFLETIARCEIQLQSALNQRLLAEVTLMKLCSLAGAPELTPPPVVSKTAPSPSVTLAPSPLSAASTQNSGTIPAQVPVAPSKVNIAPPPTPVASLPAQEKTTTPMGSHPSRPSVRPATVSIAEKLSARANTASASEKEKDPAMAFSGVRLEIEAVTESIKKVSAHFASQGKKQLALSLVAYPLTIVDDNVIELPVENSILQDEIRSNRTEILNILRDQENLKCGDIRCQIVPAEFVKHTAYTPSEKYEQMKAANPFIGVMKQKLDLDVDF